MLRPLTALQLAFDLSLAGLFLVFGYLAGSTRYASAVLMLVMVLIFGAAVALRRLSPPFALAAAWLGAIAQMLGGATPEFVDVAILAVLFATARYGDRVTRWLGLASAGLGGVVAALYLWAQVVFLPGADPLATAGSTLDSLGLLLVGSFAVLGLSWTLGLLLRIRDESLRNRRAKLAAEESVIVEQERNRIARDMHDVVAHSLAVVIAQADGARYAKDAPAKDDALATIAGTAREALADVRLLLGQLRHRQEAGPQPVLDDLDRLMEQLRASGLLLRFEQLGEPVTLPTGRQLAVYRIAQEALTNALRHGDTAHEVTLTLAWHPDAVEVAVVSALREAAPAPGHEGHGLPGMRERAVLVGGTLDSGAEGASWVLRARIPLREVGA